MYGRLFRLMKRLSIILGILAAGVVGWWIFSAVADGPAQTGANGIALEDRLLIEKFSALTPKQLESMTSAKRLELQHALENLAQRLPTTEIDDVLPAGKTIAQGALHDGGAAQQTTGAVTLLQESDGAHLIRIEDLHVRNVPGLSVLLVRDPSGDVSRGFVTLGQLKGNAGSHNYNIPEDIDTAQFHSIVLWWEGFEISYGLATLSR